jgi:hypothetical protein
LNGEEITKQPWHPEVVKITEVVLLGYMREAKRNSFIYLFIYWDTGSLSVAQVDLVFAILPRLVSNS